MYKLEILNPTLSQSEFFIFATLGDLKEYVLYMNGGTATGSFIYIVSDTAETILKSNDDPALFELENQGRLKTLYQPK